MDVSLPSRKKYIVAVSGGVDSVALLHMLSQHPDIELVVAHFDHGIREDSAEDRVLVQGLAAKYRLPFIYKEGRLGRDTSEADARDARYSFLRDMQRAHSASAIITAHHQDDALETAILNMIRGGGRKGLTSLGSSPDLVRPLLNITKNDLIEYAKHHNLIWREDVTNQDTAYLRNYIRHKIVPKLDVASRQQLLDIIAKQRNVNEKIDTLLVKHLADQSVDGSLDRLWFTHLPHAVALEVMAAWLRLRGIRGFDTKTLERLTTAAKVSGSGKRFPVMSGYDLKIGQEQMEIVEAQGSRKKVPKEV